MIKIKATAVREMYHQDNYRIIAFEPDDIFDELKVDLSKYGTFTCKGELPYINIDESYEMEIEEVSKYKNKATYEILSIPSLENIDFSKLTIEESSKILNNITTKNQTKNILEAYPNFIELILVKGQEVIDITKIKNVGEYRLNVYEQELNAKFKYLKLLNSYSRYKIKMSDCQNLFAHFKEQNKIDQAMKDNPYNVLCSILGKRFASIDSLIIKDRPELEISEQRCEVLLIDVLKDNEMMRGSTRISNKDLFHDIKSKYNCDNLNSIMKDTIRHSESIYYDEDKGYLSLKKTFQMEQRVKDFIKDKLQFSTPLNVDWTKYRDTGKFSLSDTQLKALENFCKYNISVLCGNSGSGKSATIKGIVDLVEDIGLSYTLLSPTGKASKVLSESVGHKETYTIHRRCASGEIDTDCIIIDETTMVNLEVFCMLLDNITNKDARVLLVGDEAQLSSIGLSKILTDITSSGLVPTTKLTEIFRYKSDGSLFVATNIRKGINFFDEDIVKVENDIYSVLDNYKFIDVEDDEDILTNTIDTYMSLINKGVDKQDILCLSPMKYGSLGVYNINNELQNIINHINKDDKIMERKIKIKGKPEVIIKFKTGDIVMNVVNDYKATSHNAYRQIKECSKISANSLPADKKIFNGEVGIISKIYEDGLVVKFDDGEIYFHKSKLKNLLLGYAMTTHKSQGSTCLHSIGIVSNNHIRMLTRNLLYVGDTRCKKSHTDIGNLDAFLDALNKEENDMRDTWLLELLLKKDLTTPF